MHAEFLPVEIQLSRISFQSTIPACEFYQTPLHPALLGKPSNLLLQILGWHGRFFQHKSRKPKEKDISRFGCDQLFSIAWADQTKKVDLWITLTALFLGVLKFTTVTVDLSLGASKQFGTFLYKKEIPFEVVGPSNISSFKMIVWVTGVLRRTVLGDLRLDNLRGSHPQSQVTEEVVETSVAKNNFLRTPVTKIIIFNQGMLLVGSNHFLLSSLTTIVSQSKLK